MNRDDLIYDWEAHGPYSLPAPKYPILLDDETLRDGLQCPSVTDPPLEKKIELIHLMEGLGINTADIGLPGAGPTAREHILALAREMQPLAITPNVACRTVLSDIEPVVDMVQELGEAIEISAFIGSSSIRAYAESWDLERMVKNVRDSVRFAKSHDLPVMFVTEDTVRSTPEILTELYNAAIDEGCERMCLCDTVGSASPKGVRNLVRWTADFVAAKGANVELDWHGHRDRGLGLINTMVAAAEGCNRLHGCALGIGERAGNTEMDLLLVNLKLQGWIKRDLSGLGEYVRTASEAVGRPVRMEYPVFGHDAFETGTGVHAAAVIKAIKMGDNWLADRVYSGVPAGEFGIEQKISVGPMSGKSNVIFFLEKRGIEASDERIQAILDCAKQSNRLLTEEEVLNAAATVSA